MNISARNNMSQYAIQNHHSILLHSGNPIRGALNPSLRSFIGQNKLKRNVSFQDINLIEGAAKSVLGDLRAETSSSKIEMPPQILDEPARIAPVSKCFWDCVMVCYQCRQYLLLLYDFYLRNMKNGETKLQHTMEKFFQNDLPYATKIKSFFFAKDSNLVKPLQELTDIKLFELVCRNQKNASPFPSQTHLASKSNMMLANLLGPAPVHSTGALTSAFLKSVGHLKLTEGKSLRTADGSESILRRTGEVSAVAGTRPSALFTRLESLAQEQLDEAVLSELRDFNKTLGAFMLAQAGDEMSQSVAQVQASVDGVSKLHTLLSRKGTQEKYTYFRELADVKEIPEVRLVHDNFQLQRLREKKFCQLTGKDGVLEETLRGGTGSRAAFTEARKRNQVVRDTIKVIEDQLAKEGRSQTELPDADTDFGRRARSNQSKA